MKPGEMGSERGDLGWKARFGNAVVGDTSLNFGAEVGCHDRGSRKN